MSRDAGSPECDTTRHTASPERRTFFPLACAAAASCDSLRKYHANPMFTAALPAPGTWGGGAAGGPGPRPPTPCTQEPITGPIATPAFVAAESQPSAFARSFGLVASAPYACTTPTGPPPP